MLRCFRFSCTSTHASCYAAVGSLAHPHVMMMMMVMMIMMTIMMMMLMLILLTILKFRSWAFSIPPPENVWKVTTVASLTDARHLVFLKVASGGNGILGLDKLARGLYICGSYLYIYVCVCASFQFFAETAQVSNIKIHNQSIHSIFGDFTVNSLR